MRIRELIQPEITRTGFEVKRQIGDLTYIAHSKGKRDLSILVYAGNTQIANALFRIHFDGEALASDDTYVAREYRFKGIATQMYNWAQELGNDIVPSHALSRQGKLFWQHRKNKTQPVQELFEPTSAFDSTWQRDGNVVTATSYDHEGREINVAFVEHGATGEVDVEFMRGGERNVTGRGSEHEVFATVLANIEHYLKTEYQPAYLLFSANEPSRVKLYGRMVQRLAQNHGYQRITGDAIPDKSMRGRKVFVLKKTS